VEVIHVSKFYFPEKGGMETVVKDLVEEAITKGVFVSVHAFSSLKEECELDYEVNRFYARYVVSSMPLSFRYIFSMKNFKRSVIHIHAPNPLACLGLFLVDRSLPVVITHHADMVGKGLLKKLIFPFVRYAYNRADAVIATSNNYAHSSEELRPYLSKIQVIPLGTNVPIRDAGGKKLISFGRKKVVLAMGRLVEYKGFRYLIDVARLCPDIEFRFVGDGPEMSTLSTMAKNLNNVVLLGRVTEEEKNIELDNADLFCLPSTTRAEAFGVVLLEALAKGLPIVTTEIGSGNSFVNVHGLTGFNVPPGNVLALKEAIVGVLSNSSQYQKMSENAINRYEVLFTRNKMSEAYIELYKSCKARRDGGGGIGALSV